MCTVNRTISLSPLCGMSHVAWPSWQYFSKYFCHVQVFLLQMGSFTWLQQYPDSVFVFVTLCLFRPCVGNNLLPMWFFPDFYVSFNAQNVPVSFRHLFYFNFLSNVSSTKAEGLHYVKVTLIARKQVCVITHHIKSGIFIWGSSFLLVFFFFYFYKWIDMTWCWCEWIIQTKCVNGYIHVVP